MGIIKIIKNLTLAFTLFACHAIMASDNSFVLDESLLSLQNNLSSIKSPFSHQIEKYDNKYVITLKAPESAYIYKNSIKATIDNGQIHLDALEDGVLHKDFQGEQEVYFNSVSLNIYVLKATSGSKILLSYQGCDSNGICYPPVDTQIVINESTNNTLDNIDRAQDLATSDMSLSDKISTLLEKRSSFALALCFILGSALMFTPCVLPMLPIFSAMILGSKDKNIIHNIALNLSYALGLAITYMILGLLFAIVGSSLNAILQNPIVILSIAALFVIFALSCAGLFEIKLPTKFTNLISQKASNQNKGLMLSALSFGSLSALLSTPCTSAPLAGALLFVLNSGDLIFGALAFFLIGLGMAFPLFLVGVFGSRFLPRAGHISLFLKRLLAIPLFIAAYYIASYPLEAYASFIIPLTIFITLAYTIFIIGDIFYKKSLKLVIIALASSVIVTFLIDANIEKSSNTSKVGEHFTKIYSLDDLKHFKDKDIFIDFRAKWCTNCKVMEKEVFSDEKFLQKAKNKYHLVVFDITDSHNKDVKAMMQQFKVIGVPYIIIVDKDTHTIKNKQIGYSSLNSMLEFLGKD